MISTCYVQLYVLLVPLGIYMLCTHAMYTQATPKLAAFMRSRLKLEEQRPSQPGLQESIHAEADQYST